MAIYIMEIYTVSTCVHGAMRVSFSLEGIHKGRPADRGIKQVQRKVIFFACEWSNFADGGRVGGGVKRWTIFVDVFHGCPLVHSVIFP